MYRKRFCGRDVSALGFGGLRLPMEAGGERIDRAAAMPVVDAAIERGINYFDTAYTYQNGDSERFLGEALSRYPRESYLLATKFYAAAKQDIRSVFQTQLARLQTDYIDCYLLHGMDENYIEDYMDEKKDYLSFLLAEKKAGRIRHLGFSSHAAPKTLRRFLDWYDGFDMALIQLNYIDWTLLAAKEQYEILTQHGIPVFVMEPLKGGRLATLNEKATAILKEASPKRTIPDWSFRFLMGLPNVQTVLSGMSSVAQVMENTETFSAPAPLSDAEKAALFRAADAFLQDLGVPCSACRYCCATCPAELDIPLLIQCYNEKRVSGETWRLASLKNAKGPEHCVGCGACLSHCPQKIDIREILRRLATGAL